MSRHGLPPHRSPQDRHHLPPGPAERSTPRSLAAHGVHFPPLAADQPGPVPLPRGARPARPGLGRRAGPRRGQLGRARTPGAAAARGTVIVSHEILAPAPARARRAGDERPRGADVHVVYTARDLGPAGAGRLAGEHQAGPALALRPLRAPDGAGPGVVLAGLRPPRRCSAPGARTSRPSTSTWSPSRSPARAHPTTTCGTGSAGWSGSTRRGRPSRAPAPTSRSASPRRPCCAGSTSSSTAASGARRSYDGLIRRCWRRTSSSRAKSPRITLPPTSYDWVDEMTGTWIEWIQQSGIDVVGDVEELRPVRPATEKWHDPDRVPPRKRLRVAVDALAAMTLEAAQRPDPGSTLRARVRAERRAAAAAVSDPAHRAAPGAWVAHLRDGGTTPWRSWAGTAEPAAPWSSPARSSSSCSGCSTTVRPVAPALAGRVLAADPPRRHRPALPLTGGAPVPDHGPRPVDPVDAPGRGARRAGGRGPRPAAGDRHASPAPGRAEAAVGGPLPPPRRPRAGPGRYAATSSRTAGHPAPHGGRVIVMAADAGADADRPVDPRRARRRHRPVVASGGPSGSSATGSRSAPTCSARRRPGWRSPGARRVHVVADPGAGPAPRRARADRCRRRPTYAAAAVDLGRRVVGALRPVAPPGTRARRGGARCCGRCSRRSTARRLVVPSAHRAWVDEHATQVLARIHAAPRRYPVHGDPERLLRVDRPGAETVRPRDTLAAGIRLLLTGDRPRRSGRGGIVSRRVLLHVGTPKTGTSHLQDVLFRNRDRLREQGLLYPADRFDAHFLAALDLMQLPWGGLEDEGVGAWDRLAERRPRATTAPRSSATRSSPPPRARRPSGRWRPSATPTPRCTWCSRSATWSARSPPSGRRTSSTAACSTTAPSSSSSATRARAGRSRRGSGGCRRSPTSSTGGRGDLPPERVHLVTVPAARGRRPTCCGSGSARRFGLDGLDLDLTAERANPSLGVPETALLRRINRHANDVRPAATPTGRWCASCSPTRRCRDAAARRG